jgi:hypothetical protein
MSAQDKTVEGIVLGHLVKLNQPYKRMRTRFKGEFTNPFLGGGLQVWVDGQAQLVTCFTEYAVDVGKDYRASLDEAQEIIVDLTHRFPLGSKVTLREHPYGSRRDDPQYIMAELPAPENVKPMAAPVRKRALATIGDQISAAKESAAESEQREDQPQ